ncbi:MAG: hypothetical protein MPK62_02260 [Alphaproteobacteria bacterium]|nr:hypothetical protein [Alphaproteobacteria bacterium]MDA8029958.1 hypothetical protein [Alphaproteobacteria bacterium]
MMDKCGFCGKPAVTRYHDDYNGYIGLCKRCTQGQKMVVKERDGERAEFMPLH